MRRIIVTCIFIASSLSLPFERCNLFDPSVLICFSELLSNMTINTCEGNETAGIPPATPYYQYGDKVLYESDDLKFKMKDIKIYNLCEGCFINSTFDYIQFTIQDLLKCLIFRGYYEIDGCVNKVDYLGRGRGMIDLGNALVTSKTIPQLNIDPISNYFGNISFPYYTVDIEPETVFFKLENLVQPSNHGNTILNKHSMALWKLIKPAIEAIISEIFQNKLNIYGEDVFNFFYFY